VRQPPPTKYRATGSSSLLFVGRITRSVNGMTEPRSTPATRNITSRRRLRGRRSRGLG
jgi:hypothetical protein